MTDEKCLASWSNRQGAPLREIGSQSTEVRPADKALEIGTGRAAVRHWAAGHLVGESASVVLILTEKAEEQPRDMSAQIGNAVAVLIRHNIKRVFIDFLDHLAISGTLSRF